MTNAIVIVCFAVAVILLFIFLFGGILDKDTCPYCGSDQLEMKSVDATINFARWKARCKKCGKEFYIQ